MRKRNIFKLIMTLILCFAMCAAVAVAAGCGEKYDVTFVSNGGTEVVAVQAEKGKAITEPPAPTKDGYTFVGWYTDEECTARYIFTNGVTADITLYAKWLANARYTVTFNTNGGSEVASQEIESGKMAVEPDEPTREGKVFAGWQLSNGELFSFLTPITADITLYAKWVNPSYTVTLDNNGGQGLTAIYVEQGKTAGQPDDPTREGFNFAGWYIGESEYDFGTEITQDITLTAKWTEKNCIITFDSKGGSEVASQEYKYGQLSVIPQAPYLLGSTFEGWYKDENCTQAYTFGTEVTENITLYAKWN